MNHRGMNNHLDTSIGQGVLNVVGMNLFRDQIMEHLNITRRIIPPVRKCGNSTQLLNSLYTPIRIKFLPLLCYFAIFRT